MAQTNQIAAFLGLRNRNSHSSVLNISAAGSNQRQFTMLSWASFLAKVILVPNVKAKTTRLGEPYLQHGYIAFYSKEALDKYASETAIKDVVLHNLIDEGKAKWVKTSAELDALFTENPKYAEALSADMLNGNHNAVEDLLDEFLISMKDRILVSEKEHEVSLGVSKLSSDVRVSKLTQTKSAADAEQNSDKE